VATDARGGTRLTGTTFAERGFGFVLPRDSDLAERVNRSLLGLIESGEYDRVHDRWFGSQEGGG
ncbi:MAG: transporter substrate-binding domain-containing protein, partial [Acidimicrobiia bacterium]|nr:transporter substrate-binding domain-containing protein [Acidimicrobiia bacterium]